MIRIAAILVALGLFGAPALAQDKPAAKDSAAIEKCIKTKTGRHWAWEKCIGLISERCSKNEASMTPSQVIACADRERAVWDDVLNTSFRQLSEPRYPGAMPVVSPNTPPSIGVNSHVNASPPLNL